MRCDGKFVGWNVGSVEEERKGRVGAQLSATCKNSTWTGLPDTPQAGVLSRLIARRSILEVGSATTIEYHGKLCHGADAAILNVSATVPSPQIVDLNDGGVALTRAEKTNAGESTLKDGRTIPFRAAVGLIRLRCDVPPQNEG